MVDLHYWAYRRAHAQNFDEWQKATWIIDQIFEALGYVPNPFADLIDEEMIFPKVRRVFENGQELSD